MNKFLSLFTTTYGLQRSFRNTIEKLNAISARQARIISKSRTEQAKRNKAAILKQAVAADEGIKAHNFAKKLNELVG